MLLAAGWSGSPLDRRASWEWQPQCPLGNPKQTARGRGPAAYRLGCGAQGTGPQNTALPGPFLAFLASGPNGQPAGWRPASRPSCQAPPGVGFFPSFSPEDLQIFQRWLLRTSTCVDREPPKVQSLCPCSVLPFSMATPFMVGTGDRILADILLVESVRGQDLEPAAQKPGGCSPQCPWLPPYRD